jgi:hypothetical protein
MLTHCRRARLMAYRVVEMQAADRSARRRRGYRIAVTKLDQDSAEVLMDIAAEVSHDDPRPPGSRRGRGPLAYSGIDGVLGQHRDAADPVPVAPGRRQVILDLSDDAEEYGRQSTPRVRGRRRR